MTAEEKIMFNMVKEIYHHLGLDGKQPLTLNAIQKQSEEKVLKWKSKQLKRGHECEASKGGHISDRHQDGPQ